MAVNLSSAAEAAAINAAANAVAALADAGSGAGRIVLLTAGEDVVATCVGQYPFFAGSASEGAITQSGNAVDIDATGETDPVTVFELRDSDNNVVLDGTVGESAADLVMDDGTTDGDVIIEEHAVVTITGCELSFSLA